MSRCRIVCWRFSTASVWRWLVEMPPINKLMVLLDRTDSFKCLWYIIISDTIVLSLWKVLSPSSAGGVLHLWLQYYLCQQVHRPTNPCCAVIVVATCSPAAINPSGNNYYGCPPSNTTPSNLTSLSRRSQPVLYVCLLWRCHIIIDNVQRYDNGPVGPFAAA